MSTRVLQAARSAVLAVALAALVGTTSGQVKPRVKALTLTPMDYIEIRSSSTGTRSLSTRAATTDTTTPICLPQTASSCGRMRKGESSLRRSRAVRVWVRTTPCTTS